MISQQVLLLLVLYVVGLLFGLLFKRDLPLGFIVLSAFLWGSLVWVAGSTFLLVLTIFSQTGMFFWLVGVLAILIVLHVRRGTWRLSRRELAITGMQTVFMIVVIGFAARVNISRASPDSLAMIQFGRTLAEHNIYALNIEQLAALDGWGVFLSVMHAASAWVGEDYLFALQPVFSVVMVQLYVYLAHRLTRVFVPDSVIVWGLAAAFAALMFSTAFVAFMVGYIHSNLLSGLFLFVAVTTCWLALVENRTQWLLFSMLALAGFSFLRVEAPLFALVFLVIAASTRGITYHDRLRYMVPLLVVIVAWYGFVLVIFRGDAARLTPLTLLSIAGPLAGFGAFLVLTRVDVIERHVMPGLHWLMLGVLVLGLLGAFVIKPDHMSESIQSLWANISLTSWPVWWSSLWLFVFGAVAFAYVQPHFPYDRLFVYGIPAFWLLLIIVSAGRQPYRVDWSDSANRMVVHILPVMLVYAQVQLARALFPAPGSVLEKSES